MNCFMQVRDAATSKPREKRSNTVVPPSTITTKSRAHEDTKNDE
jgi:hypothetical protein